MDFETEEQQLEAIKNWWKQNAVIIIGGIALGIAAIFGNQYYQQQKAAHADMASMLYEQVLMGVQNPAVIDETLTRVNTLVGEFKDTPYASLAALVIARHHLNAGEFDKAQLRYQWVITNAAQDELKYLSKIRLARLMLGNKQADQALVILSETYPESFTGMVLELKGDVYLSQGENDQAKAAYTQAKLLSSSANRWLQLKIDDIGETTVSTKPTTGNTEPSA
ncbi:hypothetical protein MNBD_GAMMA09-2201 [hydrothermal vent metagenome]|uniref:Ancillary SecYEG translocon subunit n=1 Tax=hydrothermal vent metagenome TaxID=652676 RepID=A0A3B0XQM9_9ZZZZ